MVSECCILGMSYDVLKCVFPVVPTVRILPNESLAIANGTSFVLTCLTSGTPPPRVTWSRDGMTLDGSEGVVIQGATLSISAPQGADSGEYHCSASSSAGLVSSSVEVLVLGESEDSVTTAVVREHVVLDCISEGEVPGGVAVSWAFNASTLAAVSDKYVLLRNGSLLILDVWVEDMGEYTCELGQLQLVRTLNLTGKGSSYVVRVRMPFFSISSTTRDHLYQRGSL